MSERAIFDELPRNRHRGMQNISFLPIASALLQLANSRKRQAGKEEEIAFRNRESNLRRRRRIRDPFI